MYLLSLYCVAVEDAKAQKQGMRSTSSEMLSAVCESVGYPERSYEGKKMFGYVSEVKSTAGEGCRVKEGRK